MQSGGGAAQFLKPRLPSILRLGSPVFKSSNAGSSIGLLHSVLRLGFAGCNGKAFEQLPQNTETRSILGLTSHFFYQIL